VTAASLFWFRDDLRLADNPGLRAACARGEALLVYILDEGGDRRALGGAAHWWLSRSLAALAEQVARRGVELLILRGDPATLLPELVAKAGVDYVAWNRRYEDGALRLDKALKTQLREAGVTVESFNAALLNEPWEVTTMTGQPMKVFTPYWKAARARGEPATPLPAPAKIRPAGIPARLAGRVRDVAALGLEPTGPDWAGGLREAWSPGEASARERLSEFLGSGLAGYRDGRDSPARAATSRLSPHLRFGEIGPRQIWHALAAAREAGELAGSAADAEKFLSELGWREFSYHLLFHNPGFETRSYNPRFAAFPWETDAAALRAWQRGLTGYPIVDAGMRELWQTGWMHNRVRMVVASFLIKHLLTDWREGEAWFWDTLVDADPANNAASWQWVAGSGADAAPYFRIFNPVTQGETHDPDGSYVRRFLPEIAGLPDSRIHAPWTASAKELKAAGITRGVTYPRPVIDLAFGRRRALEALASLPDARGDAAGN
jgi:deoxyribodipyrimidine photo-lyase